VTVSLVGMGKSRYTAGNGSVVSAREPTPSCQSAPAQGLGEIEAAHRLARDGPNLLPEGRPKSLAAIALGVLTEPMLLILLIAGGAYLALGDRGEAIFLLSFVFVVIGITFVQQRRTQHALEALRELSSPRALVIRDGVERRIAGRDVVRGDLLVLREGDRVAADARLREGRLAVDESILTGEPVPAQKFPLDPAKAEDFQDGMECSQVFASTVVTQGMALAEVTAVGVDTAVGRIGRTLAGTATAPSALQKASAVLVRRLATLGLTLATAPRIESVPHHSIATKPSAPSPPLEQTVALAPLPAPPPAP